MLSFSEKVSDTGVSVMLEEICGILQDGEWHSEEEIAQVLNLRPRLVRRAIRFLAKYGLAESRFFAEKKFRWLKDTPGLPQVVMIVRTVSLEPMQTCSTIALKLRKYRYTQRA